MGCPPLHDLASLIVDADSPEEATRVHVTGCTGCQTRIRRLERSSLAQLRGTTQDLNQPTVDEAAPTQDHNFATAATLATPSATKVPLLARGASVGRYLVIELLGAGGMGAVYAAYDPQLDRKVALKILRAGAVADAAAAQTLLLDEAKSMARLSHRNVITVHDVGITEDRVFIAMELIAGGTLRDWLESGPPRRLVLERLLYAGRGLAAAHDAGLVHRDFKPENVLIGDDGRVCVSDFGIARPEARFNAWIAGTPEYMAPEATRGIVDRRSDQYSFCLTLHEALTGTLPIVRGEVSDAVPLRLRRMITRGLAADPEARFASMAPLLAELGRTPRWKLWVAAAVAIAAIGIGTGVVTGRLLAAPAEACTSAPRELAPTWSAGAAGAVRRGYAGTPDAEPAVARAVADLDRWGARWTATHRSVCRASVVDKTQSPELLDLRIACLRDRAAAIAAVVAQLRAGDRQALSFAPTTIDTVGDLTPCDGDRDALQVYAGASRTAAPAVAGLRAGLARLEALYASGRFAETVDLGTTLVAEADRAQVPFVLGRAGYFAAVARGHLGDFTESEVGLRAAMRDADRAGDDEYRLRSQLARTQALVATGRTSDALDELAAAEATVQRGGADPVHQAALIAQRSQVRFAQGRYDDALTDARDALAKLIAAGRGDTQPAIQCEVQIGTSLGGRGDMKEAAAQYQAAADHYQRALGADAPQRGVPLAFLASVETSLGDEVSAMHHLDEAIALFARGLGPNAPQLAVWYGQRAPLRAHAGDVPGARKDLDAGLAVVATLESGEIQAATLYGARGDLERDAGDQTAAIAAYDQALSRLEHVFGADHPALLEYLARRAESHRLAQHWDLAIADFERSLALARQHGLDPIENEYMLGSALIDAGRLAQARPHLEACLTAVGASTPAALTATCQFLLAQCLVDTDRSRALALARTAIATDPEGADEIRAWLAQIR